MEKSVHLPQKNQELWRRISSAVLAVPLILGCLYYGSPLVEILMLTIGGFCLYEWAILSGHGRLTAALWIAYLLGTASLSIPLFIYDNYIRRDFYLSASVLAVLFLIFCLVFIADYRKKIGAKNAFINAFGVIYIIQAFAMHVYLARTGGSSSLIIFIFFAMVWAVDTGAYFAGRFFQGPKLCPRISPSKTWSGFLGGLLLGWVGAIAMLSFSGLLTYIYLYSSPLELSFFLTLPVGVALIAQLGDLLESAAKRYYQVKDSGSFIPGHGGFLDRFDSFMALTFCASLAFFYTSLSIK